MALRVTFPICIAAVIKVLLMTVITDSAAHCCRAGWIPYQDIQFVWGVGVDISA